MVLIVTIQEWLVTLIIPRNFMMLFVLYQVMRQFPILVGLFVGSAVWAQVPNAPVVSPRGVINAFTQAPAPTTVGAGGLIWIKGLNLGPAEPVTAKDTPWPTTISDPAITVTINNRPAPIYSASPSLIVAQVPYEVANGQAVLTVKRGDVTSRPVRFNVLNIFSSVKTVDDAGFGAADFKVEGNMLTLRASGLGPAAPALATGAAGNKDNLATPRGAIRAVVGGFPAEAKATASPDRVGEFDVTVDLPGTAQPGDVIILQVANNSANRTLYQRIPEPAVSYLPIPAGTPDLRGFTASDLRPGYIGLAAARADDGCYPSFVADLLNKKWNKVDGCLTTANRNQASPFTAANDGNALAAFVGPPAADATAGVSSKVALYNPARQEAMSIDLPANGVIIGSAGRGDFTVLIGGQTPSAKTIDPETGEVKDAAAGAGGGIPGIGGGGGGIGNVPVALLTATYDLGDGITKAIGAPVAIAANSFGVLVADNVDKPTKAKLAIVDATGKVTATRDFPADYLPIIPPAQPAAVGGGGIPGLPGGIPGIPGIPGLPGGIASLANFRAVTVLDATSRSYIVVSTKADGSAHGFVVFPLAAGNIRAFPLPEGRFFAVCSPQLRTFQLDLSRKIAFSAGASSEIAIKNPCPAQGFATYDLATPGVEFVALTGSGSFNASGNSENELNDYVYGANTSTANRSDTLYVFDGVTSSTFRFDLPPEVASFTNLAPISDLNAVVGLATNRVAGDAGIVYFDMELASSRLMPTPEGFATVTISTVLPATRKLIARGTKANNAGTNYLIYDLTTGDLRIIDNPPGVAFVGTVPAQAPAPGQPGGGGAQQNPVLQSINGKSNTIEAVTYGADRKQTGVMLIRVH